MCEISDPSNVDWALDVFGPQAGWIHEGLRAGFMAHFTDEAEARAEADEIEDYFIVHGLSEEAAQSLLEAWVHVNDHQCMPAMVVLNVAMEMMLAELYSDVYGAPPPKGMFPSLED